MKEFFEENNPVVTAVAFVCAIAAVVMFCMGDEPKATTLALAAGGIFIFGRNM